MRAKAKHDWGRRSTETVVLLNRADKFDLRESGGDIGKKQSRNNHPFQRSGIPDLCCLCG
nr:MAG TPA: hypothetical protein [Caudoviricetes sp.]